MQGPRAPQGCPPKVSSRCPGRGAGDTKGNTTSSEHSSISLLRHASPRLLWLSWTPIARAHSPRGSDRSTPCTRLPAPRPQRPCSLRQRSLQRGRRPHHTACSDCCSLSRVRTKSFLSAGARKEEQVSRISSRSVVEVRTHSEEKYVGMFEGELSRHLHTQPRVIGEKPLGS